MLHERHAPPTPTPESEDDDDATAAAGGDEQQAAAAGERTLRDVDDEQDVTEYRDIHPLTPTSTPELPQLPPPTRAGSAASTWDTASQRSLSSEEQFMTMSREFTAMVAAGAATTQASNNNHHPSSDYSYDAGGGGGRSAIDHLTSIGEDELEETNPLAIVPDSHPVADTPARSRSSSSRAPPSSGLELEVVPAPPVEARQVKKEEVETKVSAWQTAEVAKINNRFKRDEVVINGWETEQVEKASAWLKKIERKLDEQRAKAVEKTQNEMAKARRKAEERRASAEAKRGLKLAKVLELANFMKAVGRVPTKRSFF